MSKRQRSTNFAINGRAASNWRCRVPVRLRFNAKAFSPKVAEQAG
jgi:hypothetical protein